MIDGAKIGSAKILIVDHEPVIRTSMSHILIGVGYRVRSAEDGISALVKIGIEIPDIILSDLNLPSMSSFELLSVIRRCFPSIWVIAMSRTFSGEEASSGIAADAFYQKGCGAGSLLKIIRDLPRSERKSLIHTAAPAPIWRRPKGRGTLYERRATTVTVE
jgi:CheY-like chemotaxis protein